MIEKSVLEKLAALGCVDYVQSQLDSAPAPAPREAGARSGLHELHGPVAESITHDISNKDIDVG